MYYVTMYYAHSTMSICARGKNARGIQIHCVLECETAVHMECTHTDHACIQVASDK